MVWVGGDLLYAIRRYSTRSSRVPSALTFPINLKTAKALSLTIPQSILLRADQVIE
jgi:ABC-type uncharacterized transport system substrate-binding protein